MPPTFRLTFRRTWLTLPTFATPTLTVPKKPRGCRPRKGPPGLGASALLALVLFLSVGCFSPQLEGVACGPEGQCPSHLRCQSDGYCRRPGQHRPAKEVPGTLFGISGGGNQARLPETGDGPGQTPTSFRTQLSVSPMGSDPGHTASGQQVQWGLIPSATVTPPSLP